MPSPQQASPRSQQPAAAQRAGVAAHRQAPARHQSPQLDVETRCAIIARCCRGDGGQLSEALRRAVRTRGGEDGDGVGAQPDEATRNPEPEAATVDEDEDDVTRNCCEVATGPAYATTGNVPVITSGGRKSAPFSFSSTFLTRGSGWRFWRPSALPDCCEVRQYIKWDQAYVDNKGGPPHGGFPATSQPGVWYEDRDANDKRYGHRGGAHSDPIAGGGDEYTTNGVRDQAHGDTYAGTDAPGAPATRAGQFQFKLAVVDTCNANTVKASSSIITVDW